MAIKKDKLEAQNLKRQGNALKRNSVHTETVGQRAIAHSKQTLTNDNTTHTARHNKFRINPVPTDTNSTNTVPKNNLSEKKVSSRSFENNSTNNVVSKTTSDNKIVAQQTSSNPKNASYKFFKANPTNHVLNNQPTHNDGVKHNIRTFNKDTKDNRVFNNAPTSKDIVHKANEQPLTKNASYKFFKANPTNHVLNNQPTHNDGVKHNTRTFNKDTKDNRVFNNAPISKGIVHKATEQPLTKNASYKFFKASATKHVLNDTNNSRTFKQDNSSSHSFSNNTNKFTKNVKYKLNRASVSNSLMKSTNHSNFTKANKVISTNTSKKRKAISSVSSALTSATAGALQKGMSSFKSELEDEDVGVEFTGQTLSKTFRLNKRSIQKIKQYRSNKIVRANTLAQTKLIKSDIKQTSKELKILKRSALTKKDGELGQATKELKIKKASLKNKKNNLKQVNVNKAPNFIKKGVVVPLSSAVKKGGASYRQQLERDETGVEVVSKGSELLKQGVVSLDKARKQLQRGSKIQATAKSKLSLSNKKLNNASSKLNKKLSPAKKIVPNKQIQKKAIKKKLAMNSRKKGLVNKGVGALGKANAAIANFIKNFSFVAIKKAILGKIAMIASGGLGVLIPVFIVMGLIILIIALFGAGGSQQQQINGTIGVAKNLSPEVEQWRELVTTEANAQGMGDYVDLILAIVQVESGGRGTRDIMQSSESAGYPRNYYQTEAESVRQGISYLKSIVTILQGFNNGYENNSRLIAQSYNFGSAFARYVGNLGGDYDLNVAETYSRTVVAPSLGNHTGAKNNYVNEISEKFGKTYLYKNGGNFFYGEMVGQYLGRAGNISGDFAIVMAEVEKYNGWSYVWGGKTPSIGFDCSGLVAWGLKQIGIDLPSPAANQYHMTVPISASEAQPGDLIFFRGTYGGPNHISHVGFYIDANTMYDSNGSGVGYHNWNSPYWQQFNPEIRRIVQ